MGDEEREGSRRVRVSSTTGRTYTAGGILLSLLKVLFNYLFLQWTLQVFKAIKSLRSLESEFQRVPAGAEELCGDLSLEILIFEIDVAGFGNVTSFTARSSLWEI